MSEHRLWYIKRGSAISGPFPEPLVASYLLLGRLREDDTLSLNRLDWAPPSAIPELQEAAARMGAGGGASDDPEWREERHHAALRWLDDRKSPDPRGHMPQAEDADNRRSGRERRRNGESDAAKHYRLCRARFESWMRRPRVWQMRWIAGLGLALLGLALVALLAPVAKPLRVELRMSAAACGDPPAPGVRWSRCNKDGLLLLGADLHGAELLGASLRAANLRYADLTSANLSQADLAGADITGARLANAIWPDGRVCAPASVGACL